MVIRDHHQSSSRMPVEHVKNETTSLWLNLYSLRTGQSPMFFLGKSWKINYGLFKSKLSNYRRGCLLVYNPQNAVDIHTVYIYIYISLSIPLTIQLFCCRLHPAFNRCRLRTLRSVPRGRFEPWRLAKAEHRFFFHQMILH